ncbi:MAG: alpha-L-fucosidase [Anaerolineae bacterium]|nr:alpha-L-fucosidase [Anaerolineae bacterium]
MHFEADKASLSQHQIPAWFHDAKLGIFIHWGLYSVPAYAPTEYGDINETFKRGGRFHFVHNPYAEWYLNSIKFEDGPYRVYHERTYGADFSYDDFVPMFNNEIARWDPGRMADVFAKIGARYVVLTTKHHDGFLLWPSATPNPNKEGYCASRDIVGELAKAVKARGMRMGVYYSGALDWSFTPKPIDGIVSMLDNGPIDSAYARYVDAHFLELIDKVEPAVLWNDIGYPPDGESERVVAAFYNKIKEGVVNDRWTKNSRWLRRLIRFWPVNRLLEWVINKMIASSGMSGELPTNGHYDFRTPEYATFTEIKETKWECCRGLGRSFGYNQMEQDEHHILTTDLIHSFIDIVSKNGNLLLNVGPMADGTIPDLQLERLLGLGEWLDVNGEAIFGTRPWTRANGTTGDGMGVRFTTKGDVLYAIVLGVPSSEHLIIQNLTVAERSTIRMLGSSDVLPWQQDGADLSMALPDEIAASCAVAFRIAKDQA